MLKPNYCVESFCPLRNIGTGFSQPDGKGTSGVIICGESLGHDEAIDGLPFRPKAQAGSKLEEIFRLVGVGRDQFYIWNVIACQPPGNRLENTSYEQLAISKCHKYFDKYVGGYSTSHTKTILALGNIPLKTLTGVSGSAKEKQSISFLRGYVLDSRYGPVVGGYHPSFLKRGSPHFTPSLVADLRKALDVANGKYTDYPSHPSYKKPKYQEYPSLDEVRSFYYKARDNSNLPISCDIETENSRDVEEDERDDLEGGEIIQVQFSIEKRTGIAVPYKNGFVKVIDDIFNLPNIKLGFNWWNFDHPRVKAKGHKVNGHVYDLMWMFKHYHPKLERGLQKVASLFNFPFPWKHLMGANLQWYGCADVDAPLWIYEKLPGLMKERGIWHGWQQTYKVHLILDRARDKGLPVNVEKHKELEGELKVRREKLDGELQEKIPDEIKNLSPRRKDKETGVIDFGYIREPKEIREARDKYTAAIERIRAKPEIAGKRIISFDEYIKRRYQLVKRTFTVIDGETGETREIERWCKLISFKASKDQLVRYLKWRQRELMKDPGKKVEEEN